jgi:hypothetical protein
MVMQQPNGFQELSQEEMEALGPTERSQYLRKLGARGALEGITAAEEGAQSLKDLSKAAPAQFRSDLATAMLGASKGAGTAGKLAATRQVGLDVGTRAPIMEAQLQAAASEAAQTAATGKAEGAAFLKEMGIGTKAAVESEIKQRIENIKKDLRNPLFGIDSDNLREEILMLKRFYTDDAGNLDPTVAAYIDEEARKEEGKASGWDIF